MPSVSRFRPVQLYGGAIDVQLPLDFIDASDFRQVPDTQEVFVNTEYDDSIVFDLMERFEAASDEEALKEHLNEISDINGADPGSQLVQLYSETHALTQPKIKAKSSPAYITVAIEPAKKWGRTTELVQDPNDPNEKLKEPVLVLILALIRIESVATDLLITYNTPITTVGDLNKLQKVFADQKKPDQKNLYVSSIFELPPRIEAGITGIREAIDTLEIEDWSLFG